MAKFNLYNDNGYLNIRGILELGCPFNFVVGGRGTGKTYGALKTCIEEDIKFMLMRRTQAQADMINKPDFSPFKKLNSDNGWNIITQSISNYNAGFYRAGDDGKASGAPIGYTCALSTVSNIRGFDASDITVMIFDEFIPERHERPIKHEGSAFLNAYETMNRNRELSGEAPLQVLALANANDLANPIFVELGLVRRAEQMRKKGQEVYINKERGVAMFLLNASPISAQKRETALYKLAAGSDFEAMALDNDFTCIDDKHISTRPIREYVPVASIGEITIYKHKSDGTTYVSTHKSGTPAEFGTGDAERMRFRRAFGWLWQSYVAGKMYFEEYLCESLFTKYFS